MQARVQASERVQAGALGFYVYMNRLLRQRYRSASPGASARSPAGRSGAGERCGLPEAESMGSQEPPRGPEAESAVSGPVSPFSPRLPPSARAHSLMSGLASLGDLPAAASVSADVERLLLSAGGLERPAPSGEELVRVSDIVDTVQSLESLASLRDRPPAWEGFSELPSVPPCFRELQRRVSVLVRENDDLRRRQRQHQRDCSIAQLVGRQGRPSPSQALREHLPVSVPPEDSELSKEIILLRHQLKHESEQRKRLWLIVHDLRLSHTSGSGVLGESVSGKYLPRVGRSIHSELRSELVDLSAWCARIVQRSQERALQLERMNGCALYLEELHSLIGMELGTQADEVLELNRKLVTVVYRLERAIEALQESRTVQELPR